MASQQPGPGQPAQPQLPSWGSHLPEHQQPTLTKHKVWLAVAALVIFALGWVVGAQVHGGKTIGECVKEAERAGLEEFTPTRTAAVQACVKG
jgi:hypothetical protein